MLASLRGRRVEQRSGLNDGQNQSNDQKSEMNFSQ